MDRGILRITDEYSLKTTENTLKLLEPLEAAWPHAVEVAPAPPSTWTRQMRHGRYPRTATPQCNAVPFLHPDSSCGHNHDQVHHDAHLRAVADERLGAGTRGGVRAVRHHSRRLANTGGTGDLATLAAPPVPRAEPLRSLEHSAHASAQGGSPTPQPDRHTSKTGAHASLATGFMP